MSLVSLAALTCVATLSTKSAKAALALRHILISLQDIIPLGGPVEGEIAYDSTQGRLASRLNGKTVYFPPDQVGLQNIAYSRMSANLANQADPALQEIRLYAGSHFRMGDRSIQTLATDVVVHAADIHASTPLTAGWNYLYLNDVGSALSVTAAATYGYPSGGANVSSYAGSVFVTFNGVNPEISPMRRVGAHYFYHQGIRDGYVPPGGVNVETLSLPSTAASAVVFAQFGMSECFSYNIASTSMLDGPCGSGSIELPRGPAGAFALVYTAPASPGADTVHIEIQGYDETADTQR